MSPRRRLDCQDHLSHQVHGDKLAVLINVVETSSGPPVHLARALLLLASIDYPDGSDIAPNTRFNFPHVTNANVAAHNGVITMNGG